MGVHGGYAWAHNGGLHTHVYVVLARISVETCIHVTELYPGRASPYLVPHIVYLHISHNRQTYVLQVLDKNCCS